MFLAVNRLGHTKKCYVCGKTFFSFRTWMGGSKNIPRWIKELKSVGSDVDNFGCCYCGSHDRLRHLCMYFDKLDFWSKIPNARIIHFAPERMLSEKIEACNPTLYVKADLFPATDDVEKINLIDIPYADASFDILICNHVLEHVYDYKKALREMYRVLVVGGGGGGGI
jgi:SAM-dependent methyltransferase